MIFTGFGIDVAWVSASAVLLVVAWLLAWGLSLEARDERERRGVGRGSDVGVLTPSRGRAVAVAAALAAVGLGAAWAMQGPSSPARARPVAAPAHAALVASVRPLHRAVAEPVALPPVARGRIVRVAITVEDRVLEIAPGVRYAAWTFNGHVPGPIIHVRQGQRLEVTFTNHGSMPHSLDFHSGPSHPTRRTATSRRDTVSTSRSSPSDQVSTSTTASPRRRSVTSRTACTARWSSTPCTHYRQHGRTC